MRHRLPTLSGLLACAILFGLFTVFSQVTQLSLGYLRTSQVYRHTRVIDGVAGNPYQYRVLPEYLLETLIPALQRFGVADALTTSFILLRLFQNVLIFALAATYYKRLGLTTHTTLIGLSLLAWAMTHSAYDADLTFNLYFDVLFYIVGALIVLAERPMWIVPLTGMAALNRETSGLIPVMLIAHSLFINRQKETLRRNLACAMAALALYGVIFVGLRLAYGDQPLVIPYGNHPGFELLRYNLFRYMTWIQLFGTLGVFPILAGMSFRQWPRSLRAFGIAILPVWILLHPFVSVLAEARLFLVPLSLIFIPGALLGIVGSRELALAPAVAPEPAERTVPRGGALAPLTFGQVRDHTMNARSGEIQPVHSGVGQIRVKAYNG
jgi:hypothetical protein